MSNLKIILNILNEENGDIHSLFPMSDGRLLVVEGKNGKDNCRIYGSSKLYLEHLAMSGWVMDKITKDQLNDLKRIIKTHEPLIYNCRFGKDNIVNFNMLYNFNKFEIEYDQRLKQYFIIGEDKLSDELMRILTYLFEKDIIRNIEVLGYKKKEESLTNGLEIDAC